MNETNLVSLNKLNVSFSENFDLYVPIYGTLPQLWYQTLRMKIQFPSDQISVGSTWTNSSPKVKPLVISPFSIFFLKFRLLDAKTHGNFSGKRKQKVHISFMIFHNIVMRDGMESEKFIFVIIYAPDYDTMILNISSKLRVRYSLNLNQILWITKVTREYNFSKKLKQSNLNKLEVNGS